MDISAEQVRELREKTGLGMMLCKKALIDANGDAEKAIEDLRKQGALTAAKRAGKAAKEGKISIATENDTSYIYEVNSETDFVARNDDFLSFVTELGKLLLAHKPADIAAAKALTSPAFGGRSVDDRVMELVAKIGENISFRRMQAVKFDPSNQGIFTYIHGNGKIGVLVKMTAGKGEAIKSEEAASLGKDLAMQVAASSPVAPSRESVPADIIEKEKVIYRDQAATSGKPEKIWDKIIEGKLAKYYAEAVLPEQVYIKDTEKKVSDRIKEAELKAGSSFVADSFLRRELGSEAS